MHLCRSKAVQLKRVTVPLIPKVAGSHSPLSIDGHNLTFLQYMCPRKHKVRLEVL